MMNTKAEAEKFNAAIQSSLCVVRDNKIGLLQEKALHTVIKNYTDENPTHQEVKVGPFFADVKNDEGIFEIQTSGLYRLREKLIYYIDNGIPVVVVHPVIRKKYKVWINPVTGDITKPRKSPKQGSFLSSLADICGVCEYLDHPLFSLRLLLIDADEYRLLDGYDKSRKRGSHRDTYIPRELVDISVLSSFEDLAAMLPEGLPRCFTSADFAKATGFHGRDVGYILNRFCNCGFAVRERLDGRRYIYTLSYF